MQTSQPLRAFSTRRIIVAVILGIAVILLAGCGAPVAPTAQATQALPNFAATVVPATPTGVEVAPPPPVSSVVVYGPEPTPMEPESPPTLTAIASMTVIPVPTEVLGLQETIVARATASPYPTAAQSTLVQGPPLVASVQQGSLFYEIRLAGNSYLAGENGQALITLRNDGPDTLFVEENRLEIKDESGMQIGPWPVGAWPLYPGPRMGGPPFIARRLAAGQIVTETRYFQLPLWEESKRHTYSLLTSLNFSSAMPTHPDRADGVRIALPLGPVPLQVSEPRPDQRLKVGWQADRNGYTLTATDPSGKAVGPAWSLFTVRSENMTLVEMVKEHRDAMWSDLWPEDIVKGGHVLEVEIWVGAKDYVATTVKQTVP